MFIKKSAAILIGLTFFGSITAQTGSFSSLTVTGRTALGMASTDNSRILYVSRPSTDVGAGKATIYAYREGSSNGSLGGTNWYSGVDAALSAHNYWGNPFSAAIAGSGYLDYNNSAIISAAINNSETQAKLCFKDSNGKTWSGYFSGPLYGTSDLMLGKDQNNSRWIIHSSSHWAQAGQILSIAPDRNGEWFGANDNRYIAIDRTEGNLGLGLAPQNGKGKLQVDGNARVNGTVYCKELRVRTDVWADYVFSDNYKMKSLEEVEKFISTNKHLPGIPAEKEILEKGVNVVEIQTKMLKTIEEMTLHMIALKKENEMLTEKINKLASYVEEKNQ